METYKLNLKCAECGDKVDDNSSHYRENEDETACGDCYISWLGEQHNKTYEDRCKICEDYEVTNESGRCKECAEAYSKQYN